jgi:hypothetical protein
MARRTALTIPLDIFIHRIAWFEVNEMHVEAKALRILAEDFVPPYYVDEVLVQAKIAELRRYRTEQAPSD